MVGGREVLKVLFLKFVYFCFIWCLLMHGGVEVETYKDHRLAMTLYVAGLIAKKEIMIRDFEWVNISFPEFEKLMLSLLQ